MAGAGYKLFNTGDVLTAAQVNTYLMEQTVMVFADAAARTAALSGVVSEGMISYLKDTNAVEVYNGSAWVASDDPNAIQNTIVDAKGDLISASAADTPARLAVGNNGESLVADSSASTGLRWQGNFAAGKNKIINGDFGIWQRGTSFTNPVGQYTADRFAVNYNGTASVTVSRQTFTPGNAPVAGYEGQYFLRYNQTTAGTGGTFNVFYQSIEDVRTFAGQTVTVSFWAKSDATRTITLQLRQGFGSGGSSDVDVFSSPITTSTSWARYSATLSLASVSGKTIGANSALTVFFTFAQNILQTIDLWGIQVEASNVATAFQTATGTLAGELVACQRYAVELNPDGSSYPFFGNGGANSTTQAYVQCKLPVTMRVTPTSITVSSTASHYRLNSGAGQVALTSIALDSGGSSATSISLNCQTAGSLTADRHYILQGNNSSSAKVLASAEL